METDFVCISRSPVTGLEACVGKDDNAYYLYLMEAPELGGGKVVRILWLCNRKPAPEVLSTEGDGSFLLPREHVGHDLNGIDLDESSLRIRWYATGDSAAVYDREGVLGAIPPYAGVHDFPGFTRYMKGFHRYGWQMRPEDAEGIEAYLHDADQQWQLTLTEKGWEIVDNAFRQVYYRFAGEPSHYLDLDRGSFPRRRLFMGKQNDICYNLTVGMSQAELPRAQILLRNEYAAFSRMELGFACQEQHAALAEYMVPVMADLMQMPWQERDFLGHGHTIEFPRIPGFAGFLLVDAGQVSGLPCPAMPPFLGVKPRFCWIVLVTQKEMDFVREKGVEKILRKCWMPELVHVYDGGAKFFR